VAHTTKGVCGNIGASGVQAQADALELSIKAGEPRPSLDALAEALRLTLEPLVQALTDWLPPEAALQTTTMAVIDEATLASVSVRLRDLFADMDADAEAVLENEQALLASAYPKHFSAIAQAVKNFDFDSALAQLDAAQAARAIAP